MKTIQISSLLIFVAVLIGCNGDVPKPSYARTMLKVSRNLPHETEELTVRTSEGNLATLIVKRREKSEPNLEENNNNNNNNNDDDDQRNPLKSARTTSTTTATITPSNETRNDVVVDLRNDKETMRLDEIRRFAEDAQVERIRARLFEDVTSSDGRLNDSIPDTTATTINEKNIDYGNWTPLSEDGKALKLEEEPILKEYHSWKPLRTTDRRDNVDQVGAVVDEFALRNRDASSTILEGRGLRERGQRNLEFDNDRHDLDKAGVQYAFLPHQPRPATTRTNIGANLSKNRNSKNVSPEVIVRSEINVKAQPKRMAMSLDVDGTPVIHGKRVPDEPIDRIQTWRNARVINNRLVSEGASSMAPAVSYYAHDNPTERQREAFERFFKDVNRRYGRNYEEIGGKNVFFEWDPKNYKNEGLKAEIYEPHNDNYQSNVQKRMLHPDGIATYPNSQSYTPESQKIVSMGMKPGVRPPVLQYAHPELGVQPAKIVKNEKRRPGVYDVDGQYNGLPQHHYSEQRQKKKYVLNDKNIVDTYTTKNYYPNQHFYGLKRPNDEPFWVKISENLKNQLSTGVKKVSQFTKPVFDPLVEATHKISQNLGLSRGKEAQNKVDTVASGSSILIPALGLVASGAALGIGAVAVGRYLDVDVLKRSNDEDDDFNRERSLKMAYQSYPRTPTGTIYVLENIADDFESSVDRGRSFDDNDGLLTMLDNRDAQLDQTLDNNEKNVRADGVRLDDNVDSGKIRRRRNIDPLKTIFAARSDAENLLNNKIHRRKGADLIDEIVEIDIPADRGNIDITELLIPRGKTKMTNDLTAKKAAILVVENDSLPSKVRPEENAETDESVLHNVVKMAENAIESSRNNREAFLKANTEESTVDRKWRKKRSLESDREFEDALQSLENPQIAEVAHIDGDWMNTPCAKRMFCDAMIQRGSDASIFMEKKMASLLELIQPGAAAQVSSHFGEVMDAVRRHDCSIFACLRQTKSNNVLF